MTHHRKKAKKKIVKCFTILNFGRVLSFFIFTSLSEKKEKKKQKQCKNWEQIICKQQISLTRLMVPDIRMENSWQF